MPRLGGRGLLELMQKELPEELQVGRDTLFDFMRKNHLLVRARKYRVRTTFSNHWLHKYPNLIKDFISMAPNQLWVSDITYIETAQGFVYLFLITDAYSRKILGWCVSETLEASNALKALHMALNQLPANITNVIHHSDRGVQYCSYKYVKMLKKNQFLISMTEDGDPLDNPIAERVNGILKDGWLIDMKLKSSRQAHRHIKRIISIYNTIRPHSSVDMHTPDQAHKLSGPLKRRWKNYRKNNRKQQLQAKEL